MNYLKMLKNTFGADRDLMLTNNQYRCLLMVVTMNRTTDSPWPISNNPLAKYNDLTQNERKLCAFISMNLNTQEISSITLQSVNSINVAKTRLRKKYRLV